jgi:hypothetical protein
MMATTRKKRKKRLGETYLTAKTAVTDPPSPVTHHGRQSTGCDAVRVGFGPAGVQCNGRKGKIPAMVGLRMMEVRNNEKASVIFGGWDFGSDTKNAEL